MKTIIITIVIVTTLAANSVAQPWLGANAKNYTKLSEYQNDFYAYWKGKPIPTKKGSGYKQFKRWENFWETRLMPNGTFPNAKTIWNGYEVNNQTNRKMATPANWTSLGPTNPSYTSSWSPGHGRTTVMVENPQNPNSLYVGTPAGGVFKSVNAGQTWVCLSNQIASLGVSGIAVNPTDTNQIFISTGDVDAGDTYSVGVLQSNNNGATWAIAGNSPTYYTGKLMYEPNSSTKLWLSTGYGLYNSIDNGSTWNNVFYLSNGLQDFCFKPNDINTIYAVNYDGFYTSTNNGANFSTIAVPANVGGYNRIAVTPANNNYVYLVSVFGQVDITRSVDAGQTFNLRQAAVPISFGQAWYDLALAASTTNAEEIYIGILNLYQSVDGGATGTEINYWSNYTQPTYTHADIHYITSFGSNMYVCSDGGLYKSNNGAVSFDDLAKHLPAGQIYRLSGSVYDKSIVAAGLQDNGGFCYTNNSWKVYAGADGMDNAVNPENPDEIYGMYQYGGFYKTNDGGLTLDGSVVGAPVSGNWITPMVIDPTNSDRILAGYDQVYEYLSSTNSWVQLPANGNLGANISKLEVYAKNSNVMYTSSGIDLYTTFNGGVTWNDVSANLPVIGGSLDITAIEINPNDSAKIWMTISGYNAGNKVFYSSNAGSSWINISGTLPDIPVNCIKYANDGTGGLYIGTDYGVYYYNNVLNNWISFNTNLPNVIVRDIEINPTHDVIRVGTYGRGVWESNLYAPIIVKPIVPKPTAKFTTATTIICAGDSIAFTNKSTFTTAHYWTFVGGTPTTSTTKNPTITYLTNGTYPVKLVVTGAGGKDSIVINSYVTVGAIVATLPYTENFETSAQLPSNIKITSVGTNTQWTLYTGVSAYGIGTNCMYFNNYSNGQKGSISTAETDAFNFTGTTPYALNFDYGYNYYDLNSTDTLAVEYTVDCGATYNQLWYKGGADLVTADTAGNGVNFYPKINEWKTEIINLNNVPTNTDASFRFKNISGYGNNLFIDNINISTTVGLGNKNTSAIKLITYPNPNNGNFVVNVALNTNETYRLTIYNALGQIVYTTTISDVSNYTNTINLTTKAKGIYAISLTGKTSTQTQKIVVE